MSQIQLPGNINISDQLDPQLTDLASVINRGLTYLFPATGLLLLFMLIAGGFQLLTSAGNPEATAKGYKKIIFAVVGFVIIFVSYWLIQILEIVLGIKVF